MSQTFYLCVFIYSRSPHKVTDRNLQDIICRAKTGATQVSTNR